MLLLVSVAGASDARSALDGGADLIDAKDPLDGALGAVSSDTLAAIHAIVAGRRPVTAAIGDAADEASIERAVFQFSAAGVEIVKVGFAGVTSPARVTSLIRAAVRGAQRSARPCGVVAVAYADADCTTSVPPRPLVDPAAAGGATGLLLDTADKRGPGTRRLMPDADLTAWIAQVHDAGLRAAVAGQLCEADLPFLRDANVDIAGVRGAACDGGRTGRVAVEKVRRLRMAAAGCERVVAGNTAATLIGPWLRDRPSP